MCFWCNKLILILEFEIVEVMLVMKVSDWFLEGGWEDEDFLEFVIYDDEEFVYDDDELS